MNSFQHVTVLGTGVLGSQIAFQTAFSGFDVVAYDVDEEALDKARERFSGLVDTYVRDEVEGAAEGKAKEALGRVRFSSDLADAVKIADLVIEAIPEILELKRSVYSTLGKVAPNHTVLATNSSTMLPSDLAESTGRPAQFLALHFANQIWKYNTAEVMGTRETDPAVYDKVVEFAKEIGMVPIQIHKEKAGYVLNSMLVPFLGAAAGLAAGGYAAPADIDATWRIATGAPKGPFQILDVIGLMTPYNIFMQGDDDAKKIAGWLKANYIDKGHLGIASGQGFYPYPS